MHLITESSGKYVDVGGVYTGNRGNIHEGTSPMDCMYGLDIGNRQVTRILLANLKIFEGLEEGNGKRVGWGAVLKWMSWTSVVNWVEVSQIRAK